MSVSGSTADFGCPAESASSRASPEKASSVSASTEDSYLVLVDAGARPPAALQAVREAERSRSQERDPPATPRRGRGETSPRNTPLQALAVVPETQILAGATLPPVV